MRRLKSSHGHITKLSAAGLLITLGIVYGDIGTSPLYVLKAIIAGTNVIDKNNIFGALSCVIWTLTLQSTVKYIIITLRADNKGEGGIFSLFALIRKRAKWAYIFAIIGGCALLADGIITPAITVTSSIEGLRMIIPHVNVIPIVVIIITFLFVIQQFGTKFLGKSFGPMMFIWFSMLSVLGISQIINYPTIFHAFNPYYAYKFLTENPNGFILLGAVFLCTTGAEALYSDLGHCGIKNIRMTWIFVKFSLILNYLGQGAWILTNSETMVRSVNPFFAIMPSWFLIIGIIISTIAAIIASQALISGSYTLISEAISLNFWPKVRINYPTNIKGQMYISSINWLLWAGCLFVIFYFNGESSNMENAYGLAITLTMLMTTFLLSIYLHYLHIPKYIISFFLLIYLSIEGSFLIANLNKFMHGGWVSLLIAGVLFVVMYVWFHGRRIKNSFIEFVQIQKYLEILKSLHNDLSIPKYSTNLVYITRAKRRSEIESKIMYSIFNKQPKRADVYWLIHVDIVDEPYEMSYTVNQLVPKILYRIDLKLGFKVQPRVNLYFRQVIEEMAKNNEIDVSSHYHSLRQYNIMADFRFVIIDRIQNYDFDFAPFKQFLMNLYSFVKKFGITEVRSLGLDTSNVIIEQVPLIIENKAKSELIRHK
ncbi:MAG: KUP/HAK/KT family potassium transporter [Bacteroidales bacterium]